MHTDVRGAPVGHAGPMRTGTWLRTIVGLLTASSVVIAGGGAPVSAHDRDGAGLAEVGTLGVNFSLDSTGLAVWDEVETDGTVSAEGASNFSALSGTLSGRPGLVFGLSGQHEITLEPTGAGGYVVTWSGALRLLDHNQLSAQMGPALMLFTNDGGSAPIPIHVTGEVSYSMEASAANQHVFGVVGEATIFDWSAPPDPLNGGGSVDTRIDWPDQYPIDVNLGAVTGRVPTPQDLELEWDLRVTVGPECTIIGTSGDDVLTGTEGPDSICGLGGDDEIDGMGGADVIYGGAGRDTIDGGDGIDHLYGDGGADTIYGGDGLGNVIHGGSGPDNVFGSPETDFLFGGPGGDVLVAADGDDVLTGDDGVDDILGGAGADDIVGGPGQDLLIGGPGADVIDETGTDDAPNVIFGCQGADTLTGGAGPDLIYGALFYAESDATIAHGIDPDIEPGHVRCAEIDTSRDVIAGGSGDDEIHGQDGPDHLRGGPGSDKLDGGPGGDDIAGNQRFDIHIGGPGRDTILANDGIRDDVRGGPGRDRARVDPEDTTTSIEDFITPRTR